MSRIDAQFFIRIFEKYFRKLHDGQAFDEIKDRVNTVFHGDDEENRWFESLRDKLQSFIEENYSKEEGFFVKTSSRSAKDAVIFRKEFGQIYHEQLSSDEERNDENSRIRSVLVAAFHALRFHSADDVLQTFMASERIYQDMLLIKDVDREGNGLLHDEHFIFRRFVPIDVDLEFRGFVFNNNLTCLSQYNYLVHSTRVATFKNEILDKISRFFNEIVKAKLNEFNMKSYVIDFALTKPDERNEIDQVVDIASMRVWVIEINPFIETTDGALFSWSHERNLIEQNPFEKTLFRITERSRPGSWKMLPTSIRQWIQKDWFA